MENKKEKIFYLDFLRAISTIAVIAMHVGAQKNGGVYQHLNLTI